jgi:hypothetical protein
VSRHPDHDTWYEWHSPAKVSLSWTANGGQAARIVVALAGGSTDVIDVVAVSRGRLAPATVDVQAKDGGP